MCVTTDSIIYIYVKTATHIVKGSSVYNAHLLSLLIPSVVSSASVRMRIGECNSHIEVENLSI